MNHFASKEVADRYARGRPYFHPVVIEKIKEHLRLTEPIIQALDVGCGTGLSTLALTGIARQVFGVDPAPEMLKMAPAHPAINYVASRAEYLPLATGVNLITVSSAFYWFNRGLFFVEVKRLLYPGGWLVIYDNAFTGEMAGNSDFNRWLKGEFWTRYPYPASLNSFHPLTTGDASGWGFILEETHYENSWRFSLPELVKYLMSLSNITAAIENSPEKDGQISQWLTNELNPFFNGSQEDYHEFKFGGPLLYIQYKDPDGDYVK